MEVDELIITENGITCPFCYVRVEQLELEEIAHQAFRKIVVEKEFFIERFARFCELKNYKTREEIEKLGWPTYNNTAKRHFKNDKQEIISKTLISVIRSLKWKEELKEVWDKPLQKLMYPLNTKKKPRRIKGHDIMKYCASLIMLIFLVSLFLTVVLYFIEPSFSNLKKYFYMFFISVIAIFIIIILTEES